MPAFCAVLLPVWYIDAIISAPTPVTEFQSDLVFCVDACYFRPCASALTPPPLQTRTRDLSPPDVAPWNAMMTFCLYLSPSRILDAACKETSTFPRATHQR